MGKAWALMGWVGVLFIVLLIVAIVYFVRRV